MQQNKIAFSQINISPNNISINAHRIIQEYHKCSQYNELIIFPEFALSGPLLTEYANINDIQETIHEYIEQITAHTKDSNSAILFGSMFIKDNIYISAFILASKGAFQTFYIPGSQESLHINALNKNAIHCSPKNYNALASSNININNNCATLSLASGRHLKIVRNINNIEDYSDQDIIVVMDNNIFGNHYVSNTYIEPLLKINAQVILLNMICSTQIAVLEGLSVMVNNGEIQYVAALCREDTFNLNSKNHCFLPSEIQQQYEVATYAIREYARQNNRHTAIIGLSGGIDSALVATMAVDALGEENVIGIAMPSSITNNTSITDAEVLANNLGLNYRVIEVKDIVNSIKQAASSTDAIANQNIQARARGMVLMTVSNNTHNSFILNTGNKSEVATGYYTLYGDSIGAIAPIQDAYKTTVYAMSQWRNSYVPLNGKNKNLKNPIPSHSISRAPSAELEKGQTDEDSLGITYDALDSILLHLLENKSMADSGQNTNFSKNEINKVLMLLKASYFKMSYAPKGPKLTKCSFAIDYKRLYE